jgi:CheY-like chemotaxis protein
MTEKPRHYDLLITDSAMPRLSGFELVRHAREDGFAGKIIMASAFATMDPQAVEQTCLVDKTLPKPYTMTALQETVEEVCFVPAPAPVVAPKVEPVQVDASLAFKFITRVALSQFIFWAVTDFVSTIIGIRGGFFEANPFSAETMNVLGPQSGLILKELFITAPICVGGGYICFHMARRLSPGHRWVFANLPVCIGALLHAVATLNNVWLMNS